MARYDLWGVRPRRRRRKMLHSALMNRAELVFSCSCCGHITNRSRDDFTESQKNKGIPCPFCNMGIWEPTQKNKNEYKNDAATGAKAQ